MEWEGVSDKEVGGEGVSVRGHRAGATAGEGP